MIKHFLFGQLLSLFLSGLIVATNLAAQEPNSLPEGFVYIEDIIPDIKLDLRYSTDHNFVGDLIDGYLAPRGIISRDAATALAKVQQELKLFGLGLKIFDAYRPQQAVDHFVRWAEDLGDLRMKAEFYPCVAKKSLFRDEYIAARSSHTRGSTVDLTIVVLDALPGDPGLDMGSEFDYFGQRSWPYHANISAAQRAHRALLRTLMVKHGFNPYSKEWWHFTLQDEPFPDTWFNFPVR